MDVDRVVPVIRYVEGDRRIGSGYRVGERVVLTAAHCVNGEHVKVWLPTGGEWPAAVVADGGSVVDMALIELTKQQDKEPPALVGRTGVRYGRVDRTIGARLKGCVAIGYPKFKASRDAPFTTEQLDGWIPAGSGLVDSAEGRHEGNLTLKAEGSPPRPLPKRQTEVSASQWAGMSGAAVFAGELLVGVVAEHHIPEGDGSLNVVPLEWLDRLPVPDR